MFYHFLSERLIVSKKLFELKFYKLLFLISEDMQFLIPVATSPINC